MSAIRRALLRLRHRPRDEGTPSRCVFCERPSRFAISAHGRQTLCCATHVGNVIVDWTIASEMTVTRL